MPGRGPQPKDPAKRARANKDPNPTSKIPLQAAPQPELPKPPSFVGREWPAQTLAWWKTWQQSAQAELFTQTDWDFLIDTALLHAAVWGQGNMSQLAELRLRVAKFGATTEDRMRLRMVATGDKGNKPATDAKKTEQADDARAIYGQLRVVPGAV